MLMIKERTSIVVVGTVLFVSSCGKDATEPQRIKNPPPSIEMQSTPQAMNTKEKHVDPTSGSAESASSRPTQPSVATSGLAMDAVDVLETLLDEFPIDYFKSSGFSYGSRFGFSNMETDGINKVMRDVFVRLLQAKRQTNPDAVLGLGKTVTYGPVSNTLLEEGWAAFRSTLPEGTSPQNRSFLTALFKRQLIHEFGSSTVATLEQNTSLDISKMRRPLETQNIDVVVKYADGKSRVIAPDRLEQADLGYIVVELPKK
jgi:hypothetical protein